MRWRDVRWRRTSIERACTMRRTIHTVISESEGAYVAECLGVGVVT